MLLCFYARLVRSGVVCEGLSEKGDRQAWNGEDNAPCPSCLLCRSDVRTMRSQVGFIYLLRRSVACGGCLARCPGNGRSSCGVRSCFARVALW